MRLTATITMAALLALSPSSVVGQITDPRIVERLYSSTAVYPISVRNGLATVIELGNKEAIESVVVGDPGNWVIETTASANRVVIKPGPGANETNMVIVSTRRTYTFMLTARAGEPVFVFRFIYPDDEELSDNTYRFRGDSALFPRLMTDNGRSTLIFWPQGAEFPAIFVVNKDRDEVAVDSRPIGDGLIVDGVYDRIVFRLGSDRATAERRKR